MTQTGGDVHCGTFKGDNQTWDEFAAAHGTLFHQSKWLAAQAESNGLRIRKYAIYQRGALRGIAPLFVRTFWPISVAASPYVVEDSPYLGLAHSSIDAAVAFGAFAKACRRDGIAFLRLVQEGSLPDGDAGFFRVSTRHTHRIDLSPGPDAVWAGFEGRCRTAVRKAQKSNVDVSVASDDSWIDQLFGLLATVYKSQGLGVPNPKRFYQQIWRDFGASNLIPLVANLEGRPIAAALVAIDAKRGYYLSGASDPAFNSLCANNLIQWSAINELWRRGVASYDMVGSDIERLAKFKASFGGVLTDHSVLEFAAFNWLWRLRSQYPNLKQVARRLRTPFQSA